MAKGFIHTVYKGGQWVNEVEDGEEIGGVHATKEEAVRSGRAERNRTNGARDPQPRRCDQRTQLVRQRCRSRPG